MANYNGTTANSGALVKKGKEAALEAYLSKWGFSGEGEISAQVRPCNVKGYEGKTILSICGYDDFYPVKLNDNGEFPDELESDVRGFLQGLTPFLLPQTVKYGSDKGKKFLIAIQTVGSEKCRFPLGAAEWILLPDGKVEVNGFKNWGEGLW